MKPKTSAQKTTRSSTQGFEPDSSAGPQGAVVEPPLYGIASLDSGVVFQRKEAQSDGRTVSNADFPNQTALPERLKSSLEALSGLSLADVRVHANSPRPALLRAFAYTQGTDIYIAPGQARHLPHEAWHVVQQAQGRVKPPAIQKGWAPLNNDRGLEHEADVMGAKALVTAAQPQGQRNARPAALSPTQTQRLPVIQPKLIIESGPIKGWYASENLVEFLNKIQEPINLQGLRVSRGLLELIHDDLDYTIPSEKEIIRYMTDPTYELKFKELKSRMQSIKLEYNAEHGDYHFTGKVSKKKAQWRNKAEAHKLMLAELETHMAALLAGSKPKGWTQWYIGKFTSSVLGDSVEGPEKNFTMQVQVNKEANIISYHGFPDQRLLSQGIGKTKSGID